MPTSARRLQVDDERQEVGVRVERRRIEVALGGRHDPQALGAEPVVLGEVRLADLVDRIDWPSGPWATDARARSWSGAPLT